MNNPTPINAIISLFFLLSLFLPPLQSVHGQEKGFISDHTYRLKIETRLRRQMDLAKHRTPQLFQAFGKTQSLREKEALQFLLAYLPLSDLADYSGDYFLENVRLALATQSNFPWARQIPEVIFRHFVLPPRVNNENMDRFRQDYAKELEFRIKGLSMKEAALEINHWCHEKVTYKGTDSRTSGPCSTIRTAYGRCGEESVLTVSALRAAGLPARQCYTPRWAHCDDNHAWVEVWVDGRWHYMGACEPDTDLDRAWFTEPARRAMLVHAKVFGDYDGPEEAISKNEWFTEINVINHYAETKTLTIRVLNREKLPVPGAVIGFRLYNYAEFYPLASKTTDDKGLCSLTVGLGDLLVWANKGDYFGFAKVSASTSEQTVFLDGDPLRTDVLDLDLAPPLLPSPLPVLEEGKEKNQARLKAEDDLRARYEATFITGGEARALASQLNLDPEIVWDVLQKSRGNWKELTQFISDAAKRGGTVKKWALPLLRSLSEKDLRDTPAAVLWDHLINTSLSDEKAEALLEPILTEFVLCPRVRNEYLTAYRGYFQQSFGAPLIQEFREDPEKVAAWLREHVTIDISSNYYRAPLTPVGVYELKVSDPESLKVCFVALCRSFGVPARLEPGFNTPQYFHLPSGAWRDVLLGAGNEKKLFSGPRGWVKLSASGSGADAPAYFSHFTLARLEGGQYRTLDYDENKKVSEFPSLLPLAPGSYLLVSGNRLENGSVLSALRFFLVKAGETVDLPVEPRRKPIWAASYGVFDLSATVQTVAGSDQISFSALALRRGLVIGWLDPGKEPSKHVMAELQQMMQAYNEWGGAVVFLLMPEQTTKAFKPDSFAPLPENHYFGFDEGKVLLNKLEKTLGRSLGDQLPVFLAVAPNGEIRCLTEGYRIGVAELLLRAVVVNR